MKFVQFVKYDLNCSAFVALINWSSLVHILFLSLGSVLLQSCDHGIINGGFAFSKVGEEFVEITGDGRRTTSKVRGLSGSS